MTPHVLSMIKGISKSKDSNRRLCDCHIYIKKRVGGLGVPYIYQHFELRIELRYMRARARPAAEQPRACSCHLVIHATAPHIERRGPGRAKLAAA